MSNRKKLTLDTLRKSNASLRRSLLTRLKRRIEPHLRDSGYVKRIHDPAKPYAFPTRRPLRLWHPYVGRRAQYDQIGGYVIDELQAITEDGVVTDDGGGAILTTYWRAIPIEDLIKLLAYIEKKLPVTPRRTTDAAAIGDGDQQAHGVSQ